MLEWSRELLYPLDPAGGCELDVGQGLVRAVVEDGGADALGLVQADDRLHQGVVVGVADGPDRGGDVFDGEVLGEPDGCVLAAGVGVVDQLPAPDRVAFVVALPQSHLQRSHHQVSGLVRQRVPGDDPLANTSTMNAT